MTIPIQHPRVSEALAREFGLVGRVRPAIDEIVIPVAIVTDLSPETTVPGPRRLAAAVFSHAVGAAQYPAFTLGMPDNAGLLIHVRKIVIRQTLAGNIQLDSQSGLPLAGGAFSGRYQDTRYSDYVPQLTGTYDTLGAIYSGGSKQIHLEANVATTIPVDIWLSGAAGASRFMELGGRVANVTIDGYVEWEEFSTV